MNDLLEFMESLKPGFEHLQKVMQELNIDAKAADDRDKKIEILRRNNKELESRLIVNSKQYRELQQANKHLGRNIAEKDLLIKEQDKKIQTLERHIAELKDKLKQVEAAAKAPIDPDLKPPVVDASQEDGFDSLESVEIFIDDGTNNPINIKAEGKSIDFNALFDELLAKLEVDEKR